MIRIDFTGFPLPWHTFGVSLRATVVGVLLFSMTARADDHMWPDDLPGPAPEVAKNEGQVHPPAVPAFDPPAVEPGFHGPRELRVRGKPLQGTEIKVKGYVTSIYDCAAVLAVTRPQASRAELLVSIDKNPTQCERPRFYLGDTKDTSRELSIWVVDVPRPPAKPERAAMSRAELAAWPHVPRLAVGDYVVVTGTWATQSPHAERNTNGLLIYKALDHAVPVAAISQPLATTGASMPASMEGAAEIAVVTTLPLRKIIDTNVRNTSVDHLNACTRAIAAGRYDAGIAECQAATKTWDGNHLAWYGWASAHMAKREWPAAVAAVERAVTLRPDVGMYQLYYGMSLYEAEHERVEQVQQNHEEPEEIMTDPPARKLDPARDALLRAAKLAPDLWRAHYYLGLIYRDRDDARHAAEQFTQTIVMHPTYRFGYLALIELYRRWDYVDQALAVAMLGTSNVPAADAAELWYEVGMVYDAKHAEDHAIKAFSKAITGNPQDARSKYQRGQIYFRKGDLANAERDLEDVMKSPDPQLAAAWPIARQLLEQISRKQRPGERSNTIVCREHMSCKQD